MENDDPGTLVFWLSLLQKDFPVIPLKLADTEKQSAGETQYREAAERFQDIAKNVQWAAEHCQAVIGEHAPKQMLHDALDAFSTWLGENYRTADGKVSPTGLLHQRQVRQLKQHQPDMPLAKFGLTEIEGMVRYWKSRPLTTRKTPASPDTVRDTIKRIKVFVRWLHRSPAFAWRKPEDLEWGRVRIPLSPEEVSAKATPHQVETYTPEELGTLYEYASPFERLLMLLALNCGFGQAESLTLQKREVDGEFIKRLRFKSGVNGEWKLWAVTQQGIAWMLRRHHGEVATLLVTRQGKPLNYTTRGGNRNPVVANAWRTLLQRIQKDFSGFRDLSFNKLRKTAESLIRQIAGGEVAGMFLAHGQVVGDDLAEVYTNRDFTKVFAAIDRMGEKLMPMFRTVKTPFPEDDKRSNPALSLATIKRIRELRLQGHTLKAIAEQVGCNRGTVLRYCNSDRE
jgi:hypothetical protein